jgi:hypothetical protein
MVVVVVVVLGILQRKAGQVVQEVVEVEVKVVHTRSQERMDTEEGEVEGEQMVQTIKMVLVVDQELLLSDIDYTLKKIL